MISRATSALAIKPQFQNTYLPLLFKKKALRPYKLKRTAGIHSMLSFISRIGEIHCRPSSLSRSLLNPWEDLNNWLHRFESEN